MSNARKALLGTAAFLGVVYLVWLTLKVMDSLPSGPFQSNLFGFGLFSVAVVLALPILAARSDRYRQWKRGRARDTRRRTGAQRAHSAAPAGNARVVYAPSMGGLSNEPMALAGAEGGSYELSPVSPPSSMASSAVDSFAEMTPAPSSDYTPAPASAPQEKFEDPFALYREAQDTTALPPIATGNTPPPPSGRTGSFGRVRAPFLERPPTNSALIGLSPQALSTRPSPPAVSNRAAPLRRGTRLPAPAAPRSADAKIPVVAPQNDVSSHISFQTQDTRGGAETPIGHPPVGQGASFAMMNVDEHGADHIEQALESLEREIINTGSLSPLGPAARTQMLAPVPMDLGMPALGEAPAQPAPVFRPAPAAAPAPRPPAPVVANPLAQADNEPSSLEDVFQKAVDSATRDLTKAAAVARLRALKTKLVPAAAAPETTRQVPLEDVMEQMQAMRAADPSVPESIEDALGSTRVQAAPTLEGLLALSVDLGISEDQDALPEPQAPAPVVSGRRSFEPDPFRTGVGSLDRDALNTLWRDFALASEECGRNPAMLRNEVFRDHVVRNHDAICRRFGVARVAFSVKIKDGRPTLSAKPLATQTAQTA